MSASLIIAAGSELELARLVRDSLRLVDGDRVSVEATEDGLVLRREADSPRVFQENGHWVFSAGKPSDYSIPDLIDDVRNERIRELSGE